MGRGEVKRIDSSYDNVKRKPIKLLGRKSLNSKLGVNCSAKSASNQAIIAFSDNEHSGNGSELFPQHSIPNGDKETIDFVPNVVTDGLTGYTKAELAHKEAQRNRIRKQIEARASLTHRQRVSKFNEKLSMLPEHFDIPKVGPG